MALGLVVVFLRQTRASKVEIVLVAMVLRCSYHLYYGPGVAGVALWAAVFAALFLAFGRLTPLIVIHWLWDSIGNLAQSHEGLAVGLVLIAALLVFVVMLVWRPRDQASGLASLDT